VLAVQEYASPAEGGHPRWALIDATNAMLDTYQAMTASLSDNAVAKLEARRMKEKAHG